MSETNFGVLHNALEKEKQELEKSIKDLQSSSDSESRALTKTLRESLKDIDSALDKMASGSYGKCENCGQDITGDRLMEMPAARYCLDCASKM